MKLKVGLLLDSLEIDAWELRMLQKIAGSSYADLSLVVISDPPARTREQPRQPCGLMQRALRALLGKAYRHWDARYPCWPDAFSKVSARELLRDLPVVHDPSIVAGSSSTLSAGSDSIRRAGLDVLLVVGNPSAAEQFARFTRYGVWALFHGDERHGFGTPPGFWELFRGCPVTVSGVRMLSPSTGEKTILSRTYTATNPASTRRNNNARYWKAACLAPRKLEQLWTLGEHRFFAALDGDPDRSEVSADRSCGEPGSAELATFLVSRFRHALQSRAQEILMLPQWILLFRFGEACGGRISDFVKVLPPKDRFWADPHVIHRAGRYYVFLEELTFDTQKGHISVLTIDENGVCEGPQKVLERDYHLSYPSVFEHAGDLYMIPESGDNRTVELYRCVEFPNRWEFVENLLEEIEAYDATVVQHEGRWWLFANVIEERGASTWDELCLFYSESLVGGKWLPHRLNPVVSDVRRARPAGSVIREGNRLYRPAQDCSVRYGYAVSLNEITKLSLDAYEEKHTLSMTPEGADEIIGIHTYARAGQLTVVDALRPRFRF